MSVVVNLTNPSDAKLLVDQALTQYLGRQATEEESTQFHALLNQAETRNPQVATPTSRSGGLNPQQAAKEYAMSQGDAAEFAANTQYMDWLMAKITKDTTEGVASGL